MRIAENLREKLEKQAKLDRIAKEKAEKAEMLAREKALKAEIAARERAEKAEQAARERAEKAARERAEKEAERERKAIEKKQKLERQAEEKARILLEKQRERERKLEKQVQYGMEQTALGCSLVVVPAYVRVFGVFVYLRSQTVQRQESRVVVVVGVCVGVVLVRGCGYHFSPQYLFCLPHFTSVHPWVWRCLCDLGCVRQTLVLRNEALAGRRATTFFIFSEVCVETLWCGDAPQDSV